MIGQEHRDAVIEQESPVESRPEMEIGIAPGAPRPRCVPVSDAHVIDGHRKGGRQGARRRQGEVTDEQDHADRPERFGAIAHPHVSRVPARRLTRWNMDVDEHDEIVPGGDARRKCISRLPAGRPFAPDAVVVEDRSAVVARGNERIGPPSPVAFRARRGSEVEVLLPVQAELGRRDRRRRASVQHQRRGDHGNRRQRRLRRHDDLERLELVSCGADLDAAGQGHLVRLPHFHG